ncbi:MAG: sugar ABC transporter ATP-binding protein [Planctomycetota bacterium]|jgi:ribose transport system ATP-binding protein|nr:sugar ABC transporter ATP-binding protein [Planctomycetota bacterium]
MAKLLEMIDIDKSFFGVRILDKVNFDLGAGEVHALLGANGAGKSTLVKILSGAYTLDAGRMLVDGRGVDMSRHSPESALAMGVATIYQNFHLIPHLTVAENVCLADFSTGGKRWVNWKTMRRRALDALSAIGLDIDPGRVVRDLRVSQQQMLEIAIALSQNARIIIMDEPTAAISQRESEKLFGLVRAIRARGVGVIYISHRLEEIRQITDRVTVLRDGRNVGTLPVDDNLSFAAVVELIAGREVKMGRRPRATTLGSEFARVEGLRVPGYGDPVAFSVRAGEILGITGLVGAGKSEFARALFGADRPLSGSVRVEGTLVDVSNPSSAIAGGLGYLPEDRDTSGLCMGLSLKDNISLTSLAKSKSAALSVRRDVQLSGRFRKDLAIKSVDVNQQVRYLSGGNKQKVIFAKWLAANCRFLILDEPTIGIDVGAREDIYRLIEDFVGTGRAVALISSDFDEVLSLSDRLLVMSRGRITADLDPGKTDKPEIMSYCLGVSDQSIRHAAV